MRRRRPQQARLRTALTAVLALSAAPGGFTVADLAAKVNTSSGGRRYHVPAARQGRKPAHWTTVDRHYETLRTGMQTLLGHLGIETATKPSSA